MRNHRGEVAARAVPADGDPLWIGAQLGGVMACPQVCRIRIVDGRGRLVLGCQPIAHEQHVDAGVMADDLAQVAVRFVASDDEAAAVVVDQQRSFLIDLRADVNRRDIAARSGHAIGRSM